MKDRETGFSEPKLKPRKGSLLGGVFDSAAWCFKVEDPHVVKRAYTQLWGKCEYDAEEKGLRNTKEVRVKVMARKGHSVEVVSYGDTLAAQCLKTARKGDYIWICGQRYQQSHYHKKLEREKWDAEVRASFVIVAKHIGLLFQLYEVHERIKIGLPNFLYALWTCDKEWQKELIETSWRNQRPDDWEREG